MTGMFTSRNKLSVYTVQETTLVENISYNPYIKNLGQGKRILFQI